MELRNSERGGCYFFLSLFWEDAHFSIPCASTQNFVSLFFFRIALQLAPGVWPSICRDSPIAARFFISVSSLVSSHFCRRLARLALALSFIKKPFLQNEKILNNYTLSYSIPSQALKKNSIYLSNPKLHPSFFFTPLYKPSSPTFILLWKISSFFPSPFFTQNNKIHHFLSSKPQISPPKKTLSTSTYYPS